jgi:hypothetical protein
MNHARRLKQRRRAKYFRQSQDELLNKIRTLILSEIVVDL